MNLEFFIANRISGKKRKRKHFSNTISTIVITGITLSVAVMLVSVSIVTGFKNNITNKISGFGSHIQVLNYDSNLSYETKPIPAYSPVYEEIAALKNVKQVQTFAIKAGIIKTDTDIQGLVLKGVSSDFDWQFFNSTLIEGSILNIDSSYNQGIIISSHTAKKLKLNIDDPLRMWFIDESPRFRKFVITGIYETSLVELDETFGFVDIKHIQRLNGWNDQEISGLEININEFKDLDETTWEIRDIISALYFEDGGRLKASSITERYPQIFDWLNLQDLNVIIIILLMIIVAGFNMVSGILILILDRTYMIGVLKALGGSNSMIKRIFYYQSFYLIFRGLLFGNILGLGLSFIQKKFEIISLNPENYYLSTVPINLDFSHILLINAGATFAIFIFLILPSMIISRISPAKTISFK
ncbi:MAG: ABC transporter permease [Bacteroidales bacterium]|nr:ABC transporter permease [Bacteroidales bacterium]MCF8389944.1 ABC transporter permease [Bacteroidales bacterium]